MRPTPFGWVMIAQAFGWAMLAQALGWVGIAQALRLAIVILLIF